MWVGILYDDEALAEAEALSAHITADDVMNARVSVATNGLNGQLAGADVYHLAARLLEIATAGLRRRAICDDGGNDETGFLQPLKTIIETRRTPAEVMLDLYRQDWDCEIDQVFTTNQY